MTKKHLILKAKLGIRPRSLVERECQRLEPFEYCTKTCGHQYQLYTRLSLLCLQHLGYTSDVDCKFIVSSGSKIGVHYFFSDWWREKDFDVNHTDKTRKKDVVWHEAFLYAVLISCLADRLTNARKLSKWVEADLRHEYAGETFDYERPVIYKLIAELFAGEPLVGIEKEVKRMKRKGGKRTLALYELVEAIKSKNQDLFDSRLVKSLKLHKPKTGRGSMAVDWVAMEESILTRIAKSRRLCMPELPEKLKALLITRESLGLEK